MRYFNSSVCFLIAAVAIYLGMTRELLPGKTRENYDNCKTRTEMVWSRMVFDFCWDSDLHGNTKYSVSFELNGPHGPSSTEAIPSSVPLAVLGSR